MLFQPVGLSSTGAHEHSSGDAKENIECRIRSLKVDVKSWRKIKVKLIHTPGLSRLSVRARARYYAH